MRCIVSGGTGFIGKRVVARLLSGGHEVSVWSRRPEREKRPGVRSIAWDPLAGGPPQESVGEADAVIHLAGEPVAQRWNVRCLRLR